MSNFGLRENLLVLDPALFHDIAYQFGGYHALIIVREDDAVHITDLLSKST